LRKTTIVTTTTIKIIINLITIRNVAKEKRNGGLAAACNSVCTITCSTVSEMSLI